MTSYVRVSVFKNWQNSGTQGWVNTYEFGDPGDAPPADGTWVGVVDQVVRAEQILHHTQVYFNRAVVASWQADGTPYNPASFVTIPLAVNGERISPGAHRIDLNGVYNVRRVPASGRNGKLAYRGVLNEGDVDATDSGFWKIDPTGPLGPGGSVFPLYKAEMLELINGNLGPVLMMLSSSIIGGAPLYTRPIVDVIPGGAGFNRMNHRYFDVAP